MINNSDILIKIYDQIKSTCKIILSYEEHIEFSNYLIQQKVIRLLENIRDYETNIDASIILIHSPPKPLDKTAELIYKLAIDIYKYYSLLDSLHDMYNNNRITQAQHNTTTISGIIITAKYIKTATNLLDNINKEYIKLKQLITSSQYQYILAQSIIKILTITDNKILLDEVRLITDLCFNTLIHEGGSASNEIYLIILNHILENVNDNQIIQEIDGVLEKFKTEIVKSSKVSKTHNHINVVQSTIQMFGLTPYAEYEPIHVLLSDIKVKKSVDIFDTYAKMHDVGVLLIVKKSLGDMIEYNKWALTDYDYLIKKDLYLPKYSGINKKIIERFNTIKLLSREPGYDNVPQLDFNDGIYVYNDSADIFNVIETNDNKYFRFLSYNHSTSIPSHIISPIAKGEYPSIRLSGYNNILNQAILSKVDEPISFDIIDNNVNWNNVRYKIINDILEYINKNIKTKTIKSLESFITKKTHINKIIDIMLFANIPASDNVELTLSIAMEIQKFTEHVKKDLIRFLHKNKDTNFNDYIYKYVKDIVEKNVSNKKNIFRALLYKEHVINKFY